MFFYVITKKDRLGLRIKKLILWEFTGKIRLLGRCMKKQYIGVNCLKKSAWIVCRFRKGLGKKEVGDVFEVGLRPQCTLWVEGAFLLTQIFKENNIVTQ